MPNSLTVAIVDDEAHMRDSISQWLELSEIPTQSFASAEAALAEIGSGFPGIIVSDIRMPGMGGMALLKRVQQLDPALPIILITGHGDISMAVEAMRAGAYDFVEKPFDPDRLADLCKRAIEARRLTLDNRALRRELSDGTVLLRKLMGRSAAVERLREDILDFAQADGNVMIWGETGTGKSLIAHAIHACGTRQGRPFIVLNCAAMSDDAIEQRLFGPSDTAEIRPIMEMTVPCTLCLEEIEALSPAMQVRLMTMLDSLAQEAAEGEAPRVRLIAVCGQAENDATIKEALRQDLFFRIAAMEITAPSLRDRGEDVLLLFNRFAQLFAEDYGCEPPQLTPNDAANLLRADWPGNIRQLLNLAERAVLQSRRGGEDVSALLASETSEEAEVMVKPLKEHVEAFERMLIENSLNRHNGSVARVMDELALPRRTLNEKMAKYGLSRADFV
ncbi:sigma-54 dependent transcriptional regulator [Abyssibius alkaniclasticus]|uniref:sigma-54-dependent transcriptional regulator n=1 Tax=Abyssibius alkaniclasticus TaxID=2881234 RepID=UPI0023644416|nr:sigma-54 dependent transcriptional regulator [Abyssibius alkaniclasticus]UPH70613.1 sigma-54 dependent transcriptional regulator [Abyssibius alkaniclasticus]